MRKPSAYLNGRDTELRLYALKRIMKYERNIYSKKYK